MYVCEVVKFPAARSAAARRGQTRVYTIHHITHLLSRLYVRAYKLAALK